jgi:hypothetical protein
MLTLARMGGPGDLSQCSKMHASSRKADVLGRHDPPRQLPMRCRVTQPTEERRFSAGEPSLMSSSGVASMPPTVGRFL